MQYIQLYSCSRLYGPAAAGVVATGVAADRQVLVASVLIMIALRPMVLLASLLVRQAVDTSSSGSGCPESVLKMSPLPHSFAARHGHCQLDGGWVVALPAAATAAEALRRPAEMLAAGIQARTGVSLEVVPHSTTATQAIALRLEPAASGTGPQAFGTTDESYRLDIDAAAITLTATTVRGVQYAAQSLLQLLSTAGQAPAGLIDDAPDLPVRGFYLDSKPSNGLNQTFFAELAAMMGGLKLNSLILHNAAFLELSGASGAPIKSGTLARLRNVSAMLANHSIDMIAEVGPYYSFESFEGLWVRDEPFQFNSAGLAEPIKPALDPATIGPRNPTWTTTPGRGSQVDGWQFKGYGQRLPSPCRVDETTHSPTGGRTVRCDVTVDPNGGHAGGIYSDPFPIDPQGFYYVQFWAKVK